MRYKYKVRELGPEIPSINEETGGTEVHVNVGEAKEMEAMLFDDMPYIVLVTTPILEVYRGTEVEYPFTTVLDGLTQTGSGYPSNVKVNK